MKQDLLLRNCMILPVPGQDTLIQNGYIAVHAGRITDIGPMENCPDRMADTVIDGKGQLAMPGLVNAHCHAPMTLFRGLADDLALSAWLQEHIFPAEAKMVSQEMVYLCSKLAAAEMLLSGTTTVADGYFFEDEVARACVDAGMRCIAAQAVLDFPAPGVPDPKRNIEATRAFLKRQQGRSPLVTPAVFAHSPYTCSNATLQAAKALAREFQVPFFIHVAETKTELAQIAQPLGKSVVEHLAALNILDEHTICVHCVWLDDKDIACLRQHGCGVVLCPQSNAKLASGQAPAAKMLAQGQRLALGTDGPASGNTLDLFREMEFAAKLHKVHPENPTALPAKQVLSLATQGGADMLLPGMGLGQLAPGSPADIILIDLDKPHLQPFHGPDILVYSSPGADVRTVIVQGKVVVRERQLLTLDLPDILREVRALAATVQ